VTPPSDFDAASGIPGWPAASGASPDSGDWASPGLPTTCVAVHRLSDGGALMRNAAAQDAFGPPKDTDADDAFCAMFSDPDDGRRILALVGLGQVYQAETVLLTRQGARRYDIHVQLLPERSLEERRVHVHAQDLGAAPSPATQDSPQLNDHHEDPAAKVARMFEDGQH
jgi:hypothetical protein